MIDDGPLAMAAAEISALPWRRRLVLQGYSFRPTSDDWSPSFDGPEDREGGGEVGIAIIPLRDPRSITGGISSYRIFVIGETGHGLSRDDFDLDEARAFVLSMPIIVEKAWLAARGFTHW